MEVASQQIYFHYLDSLHCFYVLLDLLDQYLQSLIQDSLIGDIVSD